MCWWAGLQVWALLNQLNQGSQGHGIHISILARNISSFRIWIFDLILQLSGLWSWSADTLNDIFAPTHKHLRRTSSTSASVRFLSLSLSPCLRTFCFLGLYDSAGVFFSTFFVTKRVSNLQRLSLRHLKTAFVYSYMCTYQTGIVWRSCRVFVLLSKDDFHVTNSRFCRRRR